MTKQQQTRFVLWFTGLPCAGKSTLAHHLKQELSHYNYHSIVLDGDNIRRGLCSDLNFSNDDRHENVRRIGELGKLLYDADVISLVAVISPFCRDRDIARLLIPKGDFIEIYCYAPLTVCETRDTKGLYKKARDGLIKDFTGLSSPYEEPEQPEVMIDTSRNNIQSCVQTIINYLIKHKKILPA